MCVSGGRFAFDVMVKLVVNLSQTIGTYYSKLTSGLLSSTHTRTSILAITSQCVGLIAQIHIIERYSQKEAQNEGEGEIVLK